MDKILTLLSYGDSGWGDELLAGLWVTLKLAVSAYLLGLVLGFGLALLSRSGSVGARFVLAYNALIRGVPELLILIVLYYSGGWMLEPVLSALLPASQVTPAASFFAGQFALGLVSAAYQAEVLRGGIESVPRGQTEAGLALGLSRPRIFFRIVIPQAMRLALPGLGNLWQVMQKDTALIAVIGISDLMGQAKFAIATSKQPFAIYLAVAAIYLLLTVISNVGVARLERWSKRGAREGLAA